MLKATIKYDVATHTEIEGDFTNEFLAAIQDNSKMVAVRIYKDINGVKTLAYDNNIILNFNLWYEGNLLSSIMKSAEFDIQSLVMISGEELSDIQIGVSPDTGRTFYYVSYGSFIVETCEQNIETHSTHISCNDSIMLTMKDYEEEIPYTDTYTNYDFLTHICTKFGLNVGESILNEGVMAFPRNSETYDHLDTYRDVLDDFAEVLGGIIVVRSKTVELITPTDVPTSTITVNEDQLKTVSVNEDFKRVVQVQLTRSPQEDTVVYPEEKKYEGEIIKLDNNFIVEGYKIDDVPSRTRYLEPLYNAVQQWGEFSLFNFTSFGYLLFEPGDKINLLVYNGEDTVNKTILWTSTNIRITPGITEDVETVKCPNAEVDYRQSVKDEKRDRETYIYVDKVKARIEEVVRDAEGHEGIFAIYLNETDDHQVISVINQSADNIILNTKSLIFGEYPDGKYIEVKNYASELPTIKEYINNNILKINGDDIVYGYKDNELYIDSNGVNNYAKDDNVHIVSSDKVEFTFEFLEIYGSDMLFCFARSFGADSHFVNFNTSTGMLAVQCGAEYDMVMFDLSYFSTNIKYTITYQNGEVKINDIVKQATSSGVSPIEDGEMTIFALESAGRILLPSKMRFYNLTITDKNGKLKYKYSPHLENIGVLFTGTGTVRFEPQSEYSVYNKQGDNIENAFLVKHDNSQNYIQLTNMTNNIAANQILLSTNGYNKSIELRNINNSQTSNSITLTDDGYNLDLILGNKSSNSSYYNSITLHRSTDSNIEIKNGTLPNGNVIQMSSVEGITIKNGYSKWNIDMSGNCLVSANNSMTIKSDHYNVYIDANNNYTSDSGHIYLNAYRNIYLTGDAVYFNGVRKW